MLRHQQTDRVRWIEKMPLGDKTEGKEPGGGGVSRWLGLQEPRELQEFELHKPLHD